MIGDRLRAPNHGLALVALFLLVSACTSAPPEDAPVAGQSAQALVVDGLRGPDEECDDGNGVGGDGCSALGVIESGYVCHVPGRPCSLAALCGNNVANSGEGCDDGNTVLNTNGCSSTCGLALCGDGVVQNRQFPSFAQETCDDGNVFDGDGCSATCNVEAGFGCLGEPSRCVASGVALFNTGVDDSGRRLESGTDPHWVYDGTSVQAVTTGRQANDWPQETTTARFMASPLGAPVCLTQTFGVPSSVDANALRVRFATFNDNSFDGARVNGASRTPVTVSEPPGQPWQKNIVRQLGPGVFTSGINTISFCNESDGSAPNALRYMFVDATDDVCGDGSVSPRERCDDGGTANNDGCSSTCDVEPTYACIGAPSDCAVVCGNGVLNAGEECDDGQADNGDGCDSRCRVEPGYACPILGEDCVTTCGDGDVDAGELCDDGNSYGNDGCSTACRIEPGFSCSGEPSVCAPRCGNSVVDSGELCDDGNQRAGDGCSAACTLELGYACMGTTCVRTCGDGGVDSGEGCDDGNLVSGDGCHTECLVEAGYACSTPAAGPSTCALSCGNGALDANESCDDGNTVNDDGCSRGCRVESGYGCSGAPSTCTTTCGDGVVAGVEECEDLIPEHAAGCESCVVQPGYVCTSACVLTCGNGTIDAGEQCDDGDLTSGDGCSARCTVEAGFVCGGLPSVCAARCGDGIAHASEACDDGNLVDDDACTTTCLRTLGEACTDDAQCTLKCDATEQTCTDDVTPPAAPTITAPMDGAMLASAPVIAGNAEADAFVDLYVDGSLMPTARVTADASGAYTYSPVLDLGVHTVAARAVDRAGNAGPESDTVSFSIVGVVTDAGVEQDAGVTDDLGVEDDASVTDDAGRADAGADAGGPGPSVSGGGCSCELAGARRGPSSGWGPTVLSLVALAMVWRRRHARFARQGAR